MFRKNSPHLQIPPTGHVDELPEFLPEWLRNSWAETFYREFFCRLDEQPFDVLYAEEPSRPNVPVNVLVGLEFLKAAKGWTDEELDNEFCYNVQVRYALGYRPLGKGYFDLRTLYDFREWLARHMQERGENLLEQAFEQVTDEQLRAFSLKTGQQRMDSTLPASNIRQMGRVQLLVTVLQRAWRMLSEEEQQRYGKLFAPYLQGHAGHYVDRLKKADLPKHLQRIGEAVGRLLSELEGAYGEQPTYHVLARVFAEHFRLEAEGLQVKAGSELSAGSLQSPDDLEATYREKRGQGQRGYVVNLSETCDPENPLQPITQAAVAPNTTDDSRLPGEVLPELKARTGAKEVITDGGYGSAENDVLPAAHQVTLIQTAIGGESCSEPIPFGQGLDGRLWASLRRVYRAGALRGEPAEALGEMAFALPERSAAASGTATACPSAGGRKAQPAGGGRSPGVQRETSLSGRESAGAGALPGRLDGDWVGDGGQCATVAPLLAGWSATKARRKGAGSGTEGAVKRYGTVDLFSFVFFCQSDSSATLAILDHPCASTPSF